MVVSFNRGYHQKLKEKIVLHELEKIKELENKNDDEILLSNLDKIHTTKMGIDRIKRNLGLDTQDVVEWCKDKINLTNSAIIMVDTYNWSISS